MRKTYQEIELKFKIKDPETFRKELKDKKAKFLGKAFEKTFRFDTPNKDLEKEGKFLRVRTGFKNTLTLKQKMKDKEFKVREEIELEISNPQKMITILKKLGFARTLIMEKYREKWQFQGAEVVIDKLPMGVYIEIEGTKNSIQKVIEKLNLNPKEKITKTYWALWKDYSDKRGIKDENIVFS